MALGYFSWSREQQLSPSTIFEITATAALKRTRIMFSLFDHSATASNKGVRNPRFSFSLNFFGLSKERRPSQSRSSRKTVQRCAARLAGEEGLRVPQGLDLAVSRRLVLRKVVDEQVTLLVHCDQVPPSCPAQPDKPSNLHNTPYRFHEFH